MNISRVLIVFTILFLLFVNAQAQCDARSQKFINEPLGIFPNEIDGFKFFGEGKLSSLRLGFSTREDVEKIFGKPFKTDNKTDFIEYDSDWSMIINYFDQNFDRIYISSIGMNNNSTSITYAPAPEYIGKMQSVRLRTKKSIPFRKLISDKFVNQTYSQLFNQTRYWDRYGLTYKVFESFLDPSQEREDLHSKGDIFEIEYQIECPIQRKVYLEKERKVYTSKK